MQEPIEIPVLMRMLWEQIGFAPNEQQLRAILHTEGPLFLTAGAGSGKTRVLLWRSFHLIVNKGIKPDDIVLTTFTEKAALQLKEGLRTYLGYATNLNGVAYDISKMYIGTVHSICKNILEDRRKFSDGRRIERIQILDELQQYFFVKAKKRWLKLLEAADVTEMEINQHFEAGAKFASKHKAVTQVLSVFNRFSEEQINPDVLLEKTGLTGMLRKFVILYKAYLAALQEDGIVKSDLSLIQQKALQLLRSYPKSVDAFAHIIVDEYQDTNPIQEQLFFHLAQGSKNICVVGDDDQALYRFRGATVENFVEFPKRCLAYLGLAPTNVNLNTNYRSRKPIVDLASRFMEMENWAKADNPAEQYRVHNKNIQAKRQDNGVSVITTCADKTALPKEVAGFVKRLIEEKKVSDANQIAFLFPSLKTTAVTALKKALEDEGLKVYAPRAASFLEVPECLSVFGILFKIFGKPKSPYSGHNINAFKQWVDAAWDKAQVLMKEDKDLKAFVEERRAELLQIQSDYAALQTVAQTQQLNVDDVYLPNAMQHILYQAEGLSETAKKTLNNRFFNDIIQKRLQGQSETDEPPFTLGQVINRMTSVDWSLLDIFYQLCGFEHFVRCFDLAERQEDEAPICNLGLITQYLSRCMELYGNILTADFVKDDVFLSVFTWGYLYTLFRLGETEYENEDDPFPKGRIPFITIHQSKGLEFPVVFLYPHRSKMANPIEELMRQVVPKTTAEPMERVGDFDTMRMFYVGISRAENLLIVSHPKAHNSGHKHLQTLIGSDFSDIGSFDFNDLPASHSVTKDKIVKPYSYTADYLVYEKCPRNYMIFRKYGFVPSRSQTMFFGSLVHQTIEDLHHFLIQQKNAKP